MDENYDMNKERVLKYLRQELASIEKEKAALENKILGFKKSIEILEYKDIK